MSSSGKHDFTTALMKQDTGLWEIIPLRGYVRPYVGDLWECWKKNIQENVSFIF